MVFSDIFVERNNNPTMTLKIIVPFIFVNFICFSQQKHEVHIKKYDRTKNLLSIEDTTFKVLQIKHFKKSQHLTMSRRQYIQYNFRKTTNPKMYLKKIIRIKPLGTDFFNENILLEYWVDIKTSKVLVLKQRVDIKTKI